MTGGPGAIAGNAAVLARVKIAPGLPADRSSAVAASATMIPPDTRVAVVRPDRIVEDREEPFARLRAALPAISRGVHFVSGPSRTGDIEQAIVLGARASFRVHVPVVD